MSQEATYLGEWVTVENQVRRAQIIVHGVVRRIDDARWNSPDGEPWSPAEGTAMPVAYTTFYIEPVAVLKGTPKWPAPIPFRFAGGTFGPDREQIAAAGVKGLFNLKVGDRVIVFGIDEARYGEGGVYSPPAYWVFADALSVFVPAGGDATGMFVSLAGVNDPAVGETSEAQIRSIVEVERAGQPPPPDEPYFEPRPMPDDRIPAGKEYGVIDVPASEETAASNIDPSEFVPFPYLAKEDLVLYQELRASGAAFKLVQGDDRHFHIQR